MTISSAAVKTRDNNEENDNVSISSADEALLEMLGFTTIGKQDKAFAILQESEQKDDDDFLKNDRDFSSTIVLFDHSSCYHDSARHCTFEVLSHSQNCINEIVHNHKLTVSYQNESFCQFPKECSISQKIMRRLTDELVYGATKYPSDRSYETIQFTKIEKETCNMHQRRELTRIENFVNGHKEWSSLCHDYLAKFISAVCGKEMVLFKDKLNLKPPGGTGFAPHLDSPSLRIALGDDGPKNFVTVMVAIDDMTEKNGCLRVWKGLWNEFNHVTVIEPEEGGDPDAGGRAGAIDPSRVQDDKFESVICKGGDIVAFNGWVPHRSSANASLFSRRAVFLTYNPANEGYYHDDYYSKMKEKREGFQNKLKTQRNLDVESEMEALSSIPRI